MAAFHMWKKDKTSVDISAIVRKSLCDKDPCVMAATLCVLQDLARVNPEPWRDLVPSLVHLLWQVIDRKLPRAYDYHNIPAPWIQVHLLDLMGVLGKDNSR